MHIQPLEPRRLLAAAAGLLEFAGTAGDDVISVSIRGGQMTVVVNGVATHKAAPARLFIWAGGADDQVSIKSDSPRTTSIRVYGASGDDTITGSIGADRIVCGAGNESSSPATETIPSTATPATARFAAMLTPTSLTEATAMTPCTATTASTSSPAAGTATSCSVATVMTTLPAATASTVSSA